MLRSFVFFAVVAGVRSAAAPPAHAQGLSDLLGGRSTDSRAAGAPEPKLAVSKDRADLRLSANVIPGKPRGAGEIGLSANLDLDFLCGQFDLKSTFKSLLGKEVREEFLQGILGMLESEAAGGAMELLCQAQPTLCTLLQNHNIAANLKLGYHYDRCQAIESAIDHSQKRIAAGAIDECLREKQARGVPLADALDACRRADRVRGFAGEPLPEFDLAKELRKVVNLSDESQKLLGQLSEDTRYGGTWASSRPNAALLETRHEEVRTEFLQRWTQAVEQAPRKGAVSDETLRALVPPGYPPVTRDELQRLALLPPAKKDAALGSVASAIALTELSREIHELERALEAVAGAPTIDEAQRKLLEGRLARLRKERTRLEEDYRDLEFYQQAYLSVKAVAEAEAERRVGRAQDRISIDAAKPGLVARTRPWGSSEREAAGSVKGAPAPGSIDSGCGTCGLEYSLGTLGVGN